MTVSTIELPALTVLPKPPLIAHSGVTVEVLLFIVADASFSRVAPVYCGAR